MRRLPIAIVLCAALAVVGCGGGSSGGESSGESSTESTSATMKSKPKVVVPKGKPPNKLVVKDLQTGTGEEAQAGEVTVQYVGVDFKTGKRSTPPGIGANRSPSRSAPAK